MFEHWGELYLMAGGAAAVLIGLIFVVISLMQDRSRSSVLTGSKLYMGPIVLGVSFVLVLSAAALVPGIFGPPVRARRGCRRPVGADARHAVHHRYSEAQP
jgi:hypothetical protein